MLGKNWLSLITPFNEDRTLDKEAIRRYINFVDVHPYSGYLIGGSVGEGLLLTVSELQEYVAIVKSISNKAIMIGVIDFNYENASNTITSMGTGADFLLLTPPIYFRPHSKAIVEYFKLIANSTKKPVLIYNNPDRVGIAISDDVYASVYDIENIIGMKECDDAQFAQRAAKFRKWIWLTGNDTFLGVKNQCGIVSTMANIAGSVLFKAEKSRDYSRWQELCGYAYSLPNPLAVKIVLGKLDIIKPYFRAQFTPLPEFKFVEEFIQYFA